MRTRLLLASVLVFGAAALVWLLPDAPPLDAQAVVTPSCDPAHEHGAGDFEETIESGGLAREYILHVPPSYTGSEAVPLVLLFHGLGQGHENVHEYTALFELADQEGFVLVAPQGTVGSILATVHWNFLVFLRDLDPNEPDDVAFVGDLLDSLEEDLCIDPARVYATGISNGAEMSTRLACDLSDRIAAIAAISGLYYPPFSPDLANEPGCLGERPVPVMATHGTADDVIPYQGGPLGLDIPVSVRSIETEILPQWAAHNGCASATTTEPVSDNVDLLRYVGCAEGATVELYRVEGGEHLWPGAYEPFQADPDVNDEINANDLLWQFFQAHPLPQEPTQTGPAPTATSDPALPSQPTATVAALPSSGAGGTPDGGGALLWLPAVLAAGGALGGLAWLVATRAQHSNGER
jgi:polyhydroxybutyrate depolymerase